MTVWRGAVTRTVVLLGAAGLALLLAGCSPDKGNVASLKGKDGAGPVQGGYADENTASYAGCLEGLGLKVHAVTKGIVKGFVDIEGVLMIADADGNRSDTSPIGVDGVDRDADIKGCRAKFPGAKDTLDTSIPLPAPAVDNRAAEAGRAWARCARDAGYAMIADPVVDRVVIPKELTVDQAVALGAMCSKPIAKLDDPAPHFEVYAGVKVEGRGVDSTLYVKAIEGPIYAKVISAPSPGAALPSAASTGTP